MGRVTVAVVFTGCLVAGCGASLNPASPSASAVAPVLSGLNTLTGLNQQAAIKATVSGTDVSKQATWASSNPAVASIDAAGVVTAFANGTTTILAQVNGQTGILAVNVALSDPTLHYVSLPDQLPTADIFDNFSYSICSPNYPNGPCASTVDGGRPPYAFELDRGSELPTGMRLGQGTNLGLLTGRSSLAGTWPISICVTDAVANRTCLQTRVVVVDNFSGEWAGNITAPPIKGHEVECPGGTWNWTARMQVNGLQANGEPSITVTWTDGIPHDWRSGPSTTLASFDFSSFYFSPASGLRVYGDLFRSDRVINSSAWADADCRPNPAYRGTYHGTWSGRRLGS